MKPPFSYVPLLPVFIAQVAGVLLSTVSILGVWPGGVFLLIAAGSLMARRYYASTIVAAILIGWGSGYAADLNRRPSVGMGEKVVLEGVVEDIRETPAGSLVDIIVESQHIDDSTTTDVAEFRLRLSVPSLLMKTSIGDRIYFSAECKGITSDTDLPDEFDSSHQLWINGIAATAFVEADSITITGQAHGLGWSLRRYRSRVVEKIYCSGLSDNTANFLCAALMGESAALSQQTRQLFSSTGQAHILALSGTHVVIIASLLSVLLFPLTFFQFHRSKIVLTIAALWIFAVLTGLPPSVTRAVIMTTIVSCSYLLQRGNSSFNALLAAAILILVFDPYAIMQISFQLSFAAVGSILLLVRLSNPVSPKYRLLYSAVEMLLLPCVAMLGTIAISSACFHIFPVYFLPVAIPVTFLLTIVIAGGAVIVILSSIGIGGLWLVGAVDTLYSWASSIMETASSMPHAVITGIYPTGVTVVILSLLPLVIAGMLYYRRAAWVLAFIMMTGAVVLIECFAVNDYPEREMFLTRESRVTNIIVREGRQMVLITTSPPLMRDSEVAKCRFKYADYMGKCNVDSLIVARDSVITQSVRFSGRRLLAGNRVVIIVDSQSDVYPLSIRPDYVIVCNGFRGRIEDVDSIIGAKTVVLSYDLNKQRHDRYLSVLRSRGTDVVSTRESGCLRILF